MPRAGLIEQRPHNKEMLDVTDEYIKFAAPGKGNITYEDGYCESRHKDEMKCAEWLLNTFGGDIVLLKEANVRKIKTPDYLWNNKLWELKDVSSVNSADQQLRYALKQIQNNPGGVILNLKTDIDTESLRKQLYRRALRSGIEEFDIMLLSGDKLNNIFRHKK